jgi:hypothetical protein
MSLAVRKGTRGQGVVDDQRAVDRIVHREYGGRFDEQPKPNTGIREAAIAPTPERANKLALQLARVAEHLSAPHRIVSRIEDLGTQRRVTPNMVMAARYYMALAVTADGPSVGVSQYGGGSGTSPAYGRVLTNDERLVARRVFDAARRAAFGLKDIAGREVFDEAARFALEPILLGDDISKTMTEVGDFLSTYKGKDGKSVSGTTEVVAVLRRLRTFFGLGDD